MFKLLSCITLFCTATKEGKVVRHFDSNTLPDSKVLADSINSVL
jgi:hypothetical protein